MLFSSPDYPVFLIATFFLYGLARWGGFGWARYALMLLLADIVFMLVAKDPDMLWDPIGGPLLRLITGGEWSPELIVRWLVGGLLVAGAIAIGRRHGEWIGSASGQRKIAIGFVLVIAAIGSTALISHSIPTEPTAVAIDPHWPGWYARYLRPHSALDLATFWLVDHGHLLILAIVGVGLGAVGQAERNPLSRVVVLFVVSMLFYHAWATAMPGLYRYLLFLLLGTIALDYYLGVWIEQAKDPWHRKALVILSVCSNLGILFFFKYYDFFLQDVACTTLADPTTRDACMIQRAEIEPLRLILPAGISFHTFQSLSYTIDVYRKEIKATTSVVEFATFVLFFPQLVAGPIVRAHDLLPQLASPPALELQRAVEGLFRIVVGLFKKIAIADALALAIVDRVFQDPSHFSSIEVLCGVYAYALQIYLDFSAYSDIAIGSAQILGFDLPENFRTPYRSANIQEFWRRWHISLSTWLRDYLYISLGGSRGAEWRTYGNLSATMLLGGLWHGASWAFIVWGALHGFGLAVTRFFQRSTAKDDKAAIRLAAVCAVVAIVGIGVLKSPAAPDGTWYQLIVLWLTVTPLWAVLTAWLGRDEKAVPDPVPAESPLVAMFRGVRGAAFDRALTVELLRIAMVGAGVSFLLSLRYLESWTWIPLILVTWAIGLAADVLDRGLDRWEVRLVAVLRRTVAVVLVFHYVCLAWVFFRATSFDSALAVLRQISEGSTDHANLGTLVTTSLAVGFLCHFFADGSFRWLKHRFVDLPWWVKGTLLAAIALVLRELAHHEIVPFIYFQF
jgi:alginate O-acetyltransferase complex protein AlgI